MIALSICNFAGHPSAYTSSIKPCVGLWNVGPDACMYERGARFGAYNVGGAVLWTVLFVGAGFFFGNLDFVRHNFTLVVLAIVARVGAAHRV